MSTSQNFPSDHLDTPAMFQRLAPVRERLVTAYLPSVLDEPCQAWYRHTVTRYLARAFDFENAFVLLLDSERGVLAGTWTHLAAGKEQSYRLEVPL